MGLIPAALSHSALSGWLNWLRLSHISAGVGILPYLSAAVREKHPRVHLGTCWLIACDGVPKARLKPHNERPHLPAYTVPRCMIVICSASLLR